MGLQEIQNERFENSEVMGKYWPKQDSEPFGCLRFTAPWEALHTALYWAEGSPNGPDTPEPREAWVMQAKAMKN